MFNMLGTVENIRRRDRSSLDVDQRRSFLRVAPVGRKGVTELLHVVADPGDKRVPEVARACLAALGTQLLHLKQQIWSSIG